MTGKTDMVKFIKANCKILSIILLLAILYPCFILIYSPYAPLGRIPKDIGLQLIGYGGSILGGFLTLYGVWWTINEQNRIRNEDQTKRDEERREELINQYKPILTIKPHTTKFVFQTFIMETTLIITNKGRGEAIDINIELVDKNCIAIPVNNSSNVLTKDDEMVLTVNISPLQIKKELSIDEVKRISSDDIFNFKVLIKYKGAFEKAYYITESNIQVENAHIITTPIKNINDTLPRSWIARVIKVEHYKE